MIKNIHIQYAIATVVLIAIIFFGGRAYYNKVKSDDFTKLSKLEAFEKYYISRDGSCDCVEDWIKGNIDDPSSYEHVFTYCMKGDKSYEVQVHTKFRQKNRFGATIISEYAFNVFAAHCIVSYPYEMK